MRPSAGSPLFSLVELEVTSQSYFSLLNIHNLFIVVKFVYFNKLMYHLPPKERYSVLTLKMKMSLKNSVTSRSHFCLILNLMTHTLLDETITQTLLYKTLTNVLPPVNHIYNVDLFSFFCTLKTDIVAPKTNL